MTTAEGVELLGHHSVLRVFLPGELLLAASPETMIWICQLPAPKGSGLGTGTRPALGRPRPTVRRTAG